MRNVPEKGNLEVNGPEEIPEFGSDEEEAEFWSRHSFGEGLLEKMRPIPESVLPRPRTRPISLRFDEDVLRRSKALAERKNKGYQTMIKEFVVERLYEEEKREGTLDTAKVSADADATWPGRRGEGWPETYRRLMVGSEGRWTDDPLSNIGSVAVVKAAASALGMNYKEFGAWVRRVPEEEVRARMSEESFVRDFRQALDRYGRAATEDLKTVVAKR